MSYISSSLAVSSEIQINEIQMTVSKYEEQKGKLFRFRNA